MEPVAIRERLSEAHVEGDASPVDPHPGVRVDGLRAITALLESWTGKIKVDRYEMVNPLVRQHTAALLTFNLVSYRRRADGTEHAIAHWIPPKRLFSS